MVKMDEFMVWRAIDVARKWHGDQRYGAYPYIVHLDDVAEIVREYGFAYQVVAYLHDILEDTDISPREIEKEFGSTVRRAVEYLTDPPGRNRKERKAALYASLGALDPADPAAALALVVKAADRLANVRRSRTDKGRLEMYRNEHPIFKSAVFRTGLNDEIISEIGRLLR